MTYSFWLLVLAQGLSTTTGVVQIAVNALAGLELAPSSSLATLPATLGVLGSAISTLWVAKLQRRLGRGPAFQIGLGVGAFSFGLCAFALQTRSFTLLLVGSFMGGFYGASSSLYRFAATELVAPQLRERALSLVLVGGLIGALFGPALAEYSRGLLSLPYAGAYAALSALALLTWAVLALIQFPKAVALGPTGQGRSLRELFSQPAFVTAILGASLSFGIMNLLMTATPIAMKQHSHAFHDSALVLEWHVIAMFAPGLFSGRLISRFGPLKIMAIGLALNALCIAIALSGIDLMRFGSALIALGIGWNFLFTGASTLLLRCYRPEEKTTAQGAMDFVTFSVLTLSSLSSGLLVTTQGWFTLNLAALFPLLLLGLALGWVWRKDLGPSQA